MMVRVTYSKREDLSPKFDDTINRTTRDLHFEDCAEFMVVWRKDLIELYEDHVRTVFPSWNIEAIVSMLTVI